MTAVVGVYDKPAAPNALPTMTWDEFYAWIDEDTHAEWVAGEVILTSPASTSHQDIVGMVYLLLRAFLQASGQGRAWTAPVLMRLPEKPSGREPDLLVLRSEHLDRNRGTFIDGPADLVVEVISEESQDRDRAVKFSEYETAGIPEYWLIDPLREYADFYRLDANGRYRRTDLDADGRYASVVLPGLYVMPAWFWRADAIEAAEMTALAAEMAAGQPRE